MMERYQVGGSRRAGVAFLEDALRTSGFEILHSPDPSSAPFEWEVRTPLGEALRLVVYLFTANKYRQLGRPADEHRFQIKYGSEFDRLHEIYVPRSSQEVTLFLAAHLEAGIFVAVDPAKHNPTRFSVSVEFKDASVEEVVRLGWAGWERPRTPARRHAPMPQESYTTEVLLGFRPDFFATYVQLERLCMGADPGERLLLIDQVGRGLGLPQPAGVTPIDAPTGEPHPLELEFGLSSHEILDLIQGAFRLKVAARGAVAEYHLDRYLRSSPDVSFVERLDQDGQPDFRIRVQGGRLLRLECKNVLRRTSNAIPKVDFQRTRASLGDPCSRYYGYDEFELLAACLHPVTERWEFRFTPTAVLAPHARCLNRMSNHVLVSGWHNAVGDAVARLNLPSP